MYIKMSKYIAEEVNKVSPGQLKVFKSKTDYELTYLTVWATERLELSDKERYVVNNSTEMIVSHSEHIIAELEHWIEEARPNYLITR